MSYLTYVSVLASVLLRYVLLYWMVVTHWLPTAKSGMVEMELALITLMISMEETQIQMSALYNNVSTLRDFTNQISATKRYRSTMDIR